MGHTKEHICPDCGYQAVVSGGPDSGMLRYYTLTISCVDCRELYDVAWLEPNDGLRALDAPVTWRQRKLRCPEDRTHAWEPYEGRCPVCSSTLIINPEGFSVLWD